MSVRLARVLSVAVIGALLATPAFARSHTHKSRAHHARSTVPKGPSLIWRGDVATADGVVNDAAAAWEDAGHGHVELQPFNTASGIDGVAIGTADIAGSARGSDGSAQNAGLVFTPVAWDGLVIITQSSNPVSNLTLKQVHDIYYGKIHNWSEVGGNAAPIDVYAVASPGDGVEYSLRRLLFGSGTQPVAAPRLYVNTRKLEEGIALNPNGLGVATLSDIRNNPRLKAMAIDGKAPTVANIADGSYTLFTPLYLVTNPRSPKAADAQAFVDFMQSEPGKDVLRKHAVLPYQDGAALTALDDSRRSAILAEVGARPLHATPISAPGATYAARAAAGPTSPDTLAAKQALARRNDKLHQDAAVAAVQASATVVNPDASPDAGASMATTSAATTTYTVSKGDTLSSIARKHSVEVSQLRQWNHLKSDNIKLGQVLQIHGN